MERIHAALAGFLVLAACADSSGNPLIGTTDEEEATTDETVVDEDTETLENNLNSIDVPNGTEVLVNVTSLDGTPEEVTFVRRTDLDTAGYEAYAVQEDPLDRLFIALTATSTDNAVRAAIVHDGGQFNRYQSGRYFEQTGPYTAPSITAGEGQVSYAGTYAGITNIRSTTGAGLLPIPGTVDTTTLPDLPGEGFRVSGLVFLNANFSDAVVNGEIYNRNLIDPSDLSVASVQPALEMVITDIDTVTGAFSGDVEIFGEVGETSGSYEGTFGGDGATSVAGVVAMTNFNENIEDEEEVGIFVLTKCGATGDSALCDIVE